MWDINISQFTRLVAWIVSILESHAGKNHAPKQVSVPLTQYVAHDSSFVALAAASFPMVQSEVSY